MTQKSKTATEQPRPEQAASGVTGSTSICECSHPRSEHVLSVGPRDRCAGTAERGTPCDCSKFTLRKGNYDVPAAPERGEWRVVNFTKDGANEWMVVTRTGRTVALSNTNDARQAEAEMRQIVTEHNQHPTLIEQRERLIEGLRLAVDWMQGKRGGPSEGLLAAQVMKRLEVLLSAIEHESQ